MNSVLQNPVRSYFRVASLGFGVVLAANGTSLVTSSERRSAAVAHPEAVATALVAKSVQFGLLWPALIIRALSAPREVFVLGGSRGIDVVAWGWRDREAGFFERRRARREAEGKRRWWDHFER
jgi:hypothetical protein